MSPENFSEDEVTRMYDDVRDMGLRLLEETAKKFCYPKNE
jgi:hypothetical protein